MANPTVLSAITTLYSAAEPGGRVFQAGEPWPGDSWSLTPGGPAVGSATNVQALVDLNDAQERIEGLGAQVAANASDLAVIAAERDEANAKVAGLEQRAIAAEAAQKDAEEAAKTYMEERDTARSSLTTVGEKLTKAQTDLEAAKAEADKVPGLVEQLNAANQTIADGKAATKPVKAAKAPDAT